MVYLFSDCHPEGRSRSQCDEIRKLLRTLSKQDSLVVVEDKSYYSGFHKGVHLLTDYCADSSYTEVLPGLSKQCRINLLRLVNAECRFVSSVFKDLLRVYGPQKYSETEDLERFARYFDINYSSLEEEYNHLTQSLEKYNDLPFNDFYTAVYKDVSACWNLLKADFRLWQQTAHGSKKFTDYLLDKFPDNQVFKAYTESMANCVDAKAIHAIYNADQEHIYVFMGGAHIQTVYGYLRRNGFVFDQFYGFLSRDYSQEKIEAIIEEKNLNNWVEIDKWFWDNPRDEPIDPVIFKIFHHKSKTAWSFTLKDAVPICAIICVSAYVVLANLAR